MKKKGFTLIELLGVIVILSVVALITIPIVTNVIEDIKKKALVNSANGILEAANYYYTIHRNDIGEYIGFEIEDNVQVDSNNKLEYKGKIKNGYVRITNTGMVALCIDDETYYATKTLNENEVTIGDGICTADFDNDFDGFITTGGANYVGIRLDLKNYKSASDLPRTSHEGYIGVISDVKISGYYFSHEGIENPKEGFVWVVQNSKADAHIKNDNSKIGVTSILQYVNGKWIPRESYIYNEDKWVQLSQFENTDLIWNFDHENAYETFKAPYSGIYQVELWGAQGGSINATYAGGLGAYTKGDIYLNQGEEIYLYIGTQPTTTAGGYNGGGNGYGGSGRGGGGATDVRTTASSNWNDSAGLKARIMVAAGGSGASTHDTSWETRGGAGGGLIGKYGTGNSSAMAYKSIRPATQSLGGLSHFTYQGASGGFGYGGNSYANWSNGGGGSGWYGGAGAAHAGAITTGGSSYISGHIGCNSVDDDLKSTGSAYSKTGKFFTNTVMIDGDGYSWKDVMGTQTMMPSKTNTGTVYGNSGDGHAKITLKTPFYKSEETLKNEIINNNKAWYYDFNNSYQIFEAPKNGMYKIELWGAEGGSVNATYAGGKGAYTSGEIYLEKGQKYYVYVGGKSYNSTGGYNGGGNGYNGGYGGAGSTDIRTVPSDSWNNKSSLYSRIMVAAGGSGSSNYESSWIASGGAGGGLKGLFGTGNSSAVSFKAFREATQSFGGTAHSTYQGAPGGFGYGGNSYANWSNSGGGSGWYGGAGASHAGAITSGGSSYISGHNGCNSIDENGINTGSAYSFTNQIFINTKMIDGEGYSWSYKREKQINMPDKYKSGDVVGNYEDGYAKITLIKELTNNNYVTDLLSKETVWNYFTNNSYQVFRAPYTGTYKVELWGAQGDTYNSSFDGGLGAYTKGEIKLDAGTELYVYVGGKGLLTAGGYNGGGNGYGGAGRGGGGATDIRTVSGAWDNKLGLASRIIVAAGGTGSSYHDSSWAVKGGAGGGLTGKVGSGNSSAISYKELSAANQYQGGIPNTTYSGAAGRFGIGGNSYANWSNSGGGSGWYGSSGASHAGSVHSGGSSYISGHKGCIAVDNNGNPLKKEDTSDINDSYSWTGYKFTNTVMQDGDGYKWSDKIGLLPSNMILWDDTNKTYGNTGDGYARITYIK